MRLEGGASLGPEYPTHEHWPEHHAYLILLGVRHLGRAGRANIHFGPAANSLHRLSLQIILIRASTAQQVVRPMHDGGSGVASRRWENAGYFQSQRVFFHR